MSSALGAAAPEVHISLAGRTGEARAIALALPPFVADDPQRGADALLAKHSPGEAARLAYAGHLLVENRHGLIVSSALTPAYGRAEPEAALLLLSQEGERQHHRLTVGADGGYHTKEFVQRARALGITPHVAEKARYNAIDQRTTTWEGYAVSLRRRKIVEEAFGWMKTVGGLRKLRHRGLAKVRAIFTFTCACFNLVRLRRLGAEPALA